MRTETHSILLVATLLAVLPARAVFAQDAPSSAASLERLLTVGWDSKPDSRAAAQRIYEAYLDAHPGDRTATYAYALVRMQQRQYPESGKLLDSLTAIDKQNLAVWRAKAWVSMLTRNHAAALVELDKLSQALETEMGAPAPGDPVAAKIAAERHAELIGFLGRMIGFLEGPAKGAVSAANVDAAKSKIAARLPESQREAFAAAARSVTDQYAVLTAAKDDAQAGEIAAAEKAKRETLAALDKEAVDVAARKDALRSDSEKLRSEAQAAVETFDKADRPLAADVTRLSAQGAALSRDLANVATELALLRSRADMEEDPILLDRLLRDIARLEVVASRIDANLAGVERAGRAVQAQRAALAARHQQALAGLAASQVRLEREAKALDDKLKRADNERARLRKPAVGNTGKVISLRTEAQSLTTYETFPLEAERQRLLDALK